MPNRILKYTLDVVPRQMIQVRKGAKLLGVNVQTEYPQLYVLIDTNVTGFETRIFRIVTTGDVFNAEGCTHLGTVQLGGLAKGEEGWYVAHVFEQTDGHPDPVSDRYQADMAEVRKELVDAGATL